jgi:adenylate kinase family enzyme
MRISIIGHAASGKSTLARKISEKFQIPHLHIDRLWFESGAHKFFKQNNVENLEKAREWIKAKVDEWTDQKDWVSDGWYSRVQPMVTAKADMLIFIDISLWRRMTNHIKRVFVDDRHKELSAWDEIRFIFEMPYRTFTRHAKIHQFIKDNASKLVVLKSYEEVNKFMETPLKP